jgi:N-succinyldiaminopimelate aminotransferase
VLQHKRDLLSGGLRAAGFAVTLPQAGYFVVADAAPLGFDSAVDLCRRLPDLAGVVGVPISAFVRDDPTAEYGSLVRFAFCKRESVLTDAVARLAALAR